MINKPASKSEEGKQEPADKPAEKPVSLHPLEFEEAVKSLLSVKKGLATTRKTDS